MRVLVLCGGASSERNVSYASGDAVAGWVAALGHEVWKYDPEQPGELFGPEHKLSSGVIGVDAPTLASEAGFNPRVAQGLLNVLERQEIDVVFPILHGGYGEDGTLQSLLEWVGMPFTGSGARSCAVAMHKPTAKVLFNAAGVPVPRGFAANVDEMNAETKLVDRIEREIGYPAVIKPQSGGSTVGLTIAQNANEAHAGLALVREQRDVALCEQYFSGREIAATVIDGVAFPLVEIKPKAGFYDYTNKYTAGRTEYVCPAELDAGVAAAIQAAAVNAFRAGDARGFARVDFLVRDSDFVCLELNSLPGMTATSLVPKAARARGWTPETMIARILDIACQPAGALRS